MWREYEAGTNELVDGRKGSDDLDDLGMKLYIII